MKICLINNLYKPYNRGGAENIVELIAQGLTKSGHDVFIISTKPIVSRSEIQDQKSKIYFIPSLFFDLNKLPKPLRLPWHLIDMFDIGSYLKIKKILKKEKPDVVMTHNLKGVSYLIPHLIRKLKIKHTHTLHDIQLIHPSGLMLCGKEKKINGALTKLYSSLCQALFGSPEAVISPSKWLLETHINKNFFPQSKKIILPNPVPNIPNFDRKEPGGAFRLLYVGQIEKHKGIFFLLKAFEALVGQAGQKNLALALVGSGSKLKQARKKSLANKRIKFLGRQEKENALKEMARSDCLVLPSLCYENSPTVIYEAASIGLPVIASRLGGTIELVHELGGLLFNPKSEGDLMYQMKWATDNPDEMQKISRRQKNKINKFNLDKYINRLLRFNGQKWLVK